MFEARAAPKIALETPARRIAEKKMNILNFI
jgi:hypothetical protein